MESQHTPGPWLFRGKSDSVHMAPPAPYQFGESIFRFDEEEGPGDADLNLILAAPDLLAACIGLLERYRVMGCGDGIEAQNAALAIAKATRA